MRRILAMGFMFLCAGSLAAAAGTAQLVVVNAKTNTKGSQVGSVVFLAPDSYEALGTVDVGPDPTFAVLSPDQRLLYVGHAGGEGPRGPEQGALSVLDTHARRLVATIGMPREMPWLRFAPDGSRLFCLHSGKQAQRSLLTWIDASSHKQGGGIELAPGVADVLFSRDGRWLYVLHGEAGGEGKRIPPQLSIIDTAENKLAGELRLLNAPADMIASPDGRWIYVLDRGRPSKDPATHKDGAVFVVDAETRQIAGTLAAGWAPFGMQLHRGTGRLYLMSRAPAGGKTGLVYAIAGKEMRAIEVGDSPVYVKFGPDENRLVVVCLRSVSLVDLTLAKEIRRIPLKRTADDLVLAADGRRAYLHEGSGTNVTVLDLEGERAPLVVKTGGGLFGPSGSQEGALALSKDGRMLYVVNPLEKSVVVVDTGTLEVVHRIAIGIGAYLARRSPDQRYLFVLGSTEVTVIDTEKNAVAHRQEVSQGGLFRIQERELVFSGPRRAAFLSDSNAIHVLSLRSGKRTKLVAGLPSPRKILLPSAFDELDKTRAKLEEHLDAAERFQEDGQLEKAHQAYGLARALAPGDKALVGRVVELLKNAGKHEAALAELQAWLADAPSNPGRCWEVAAFYLNKGRREQAAPLLECALAGASEVPPALLHVELARSFLAMRNVEKALRHAEQAKALGDPRGEGLLKEIRASR